MQTTVPKVILWTAIIIAIAAFEAGNVDIGGWTVTVPLGIAVAVHAVLTYGFNNFLYFILHPDRDFRGVWIYKLTNQSSGRVLFGKFTINQSLDNVEIRNAKVWYGDKSITRTSHRGNWTGVNSSILFDERELFVRFKMTANVEESNPKRKPGQAYYGTLTLHYTADQNRPTQLNGNFRDNKTETEDYGHVLCDKVAKNEFDQPLVILLQRTFSRTADVDDDETLTVT